MGGPNPFKTVERSKKTVKKKDSGDGKVASESKSIF